MAEARAEAERAALDEPALGEARRAGARRGKARRLGCALALLFWFAVLMMPCALFYLAARGEIRLEQRQAPQPHAHPLLLIALVSEAEDRGLRIERSWIAGSQLDDNSLCVETAVSFLLWEASGGNQNVSFCDCYTRQDSGADWEFARTYGDVC